jgi:hypothetical protein
MAESQIGFALNIIPLVFSSISEITTVTDALRASNILNMGAAAITGVLTTATIA